MKILITGANGFIGQNLIARLVDRSDIDILHYSTGASRLLLEHNLRECDFLFHLAAVHRPKESSEFYRINDDFFGEILHSLEEYGNRCPILLTSSIQAQDNNDYGRSKRIAEQMLREHSSKMESEAIIYRLINTFGRWARPNSHSVVATFCYNISRDLPITISNRKIQMNFYYIDDVIDSFISCLDSERINNCIQPTIDDSKIYSISLGQLADTIMYFRKCEKKGVQPVTSTKLEMLLYTTYNSYK